VSLKNELPALLQSALDKLLAEGVLPEGLSPRIDVTQPRDPEHGDCATNLALALAKQAGRNPRELAQQISAALPAHALLEKVEVAGPGFINFFAARGARFKVVGEILSAGESFGRSTLGEQRRVQVEFVSANPTGPLHVGHGRGAAYGATIGNILEAVGYDVQREYYVNDAGRQMDILATSTWLRYLELAGEELPFPSNGYQGDYIWDIAATLHRERGDALRHPAQAVFADLPRDSSDQEAHIDGLIGRGKQLLGDDYEVIHRQTLDTILDDIRDDLSRFGVNYDVWFSERSLATNGDLERAITQLRENGHLYERNGATWFRATAFGDEKDRVVVRDNGQATYFASDIAYVLNKLDRGFERVIYVWGADHHGYVPRMKAVARALGAEPGQLEFLLVQFAVLYRHGERLQMSTRSGEFVTLRQLRKDVGSDAARFFYVMRRCEQHLDFDLDLATAHKNENPMFYIQYAHARICSVLRECEQKSLHYEEKNGLAHLESLVAEQESTLVKTLERYAGVIESAAQRLEPHQLTNYLRELANGFHTYYNGQRLLVDEAPLRDARLTLARAVRQVLANGLQLLGVSAPESM
jgi:arginyl-tRNA synthetase